MQAEFLFLGEELEARLKSGREVMKGRKGICLREKSF